jgi:hypothetical protein
MQRLGNIGYKYTFKGSILNLERRFVGQPLTLPIETRRIFKKVSETNTEIQKAFNAACRMYTLSLVLGKQHPSIRAAYQYGAIDSIIQTNKKKYRGFTSFMTKYANAGTDVCELIHSKLRSAHWHGGNLPLGEMSYVNDLIYDVNALPIFSISESTSRLMRLAIINWLDEHVQFSECC